MTYDLWVLYPSDFKNFNMDSNAEGSGRFLYLKEVIMYVKGIRGIWTLHFVLHEWAASAASKSASHLCMIYLCTPLFFLMNLSVMTGL